MELKIRHIPMIGQSSAGPRARRGNHRWETIRLNKEAHACHLTPRMRDRKCDQLLWLCGRTCSLWLSGQAGGAGE